MNFKRLPSLEIEDCSFVLLVPHNVGRNLDLVRKKKMHVCCCLHGVLKLLPCGTNDIVAPGDYHLFFTASYFLLLIPDVMGLLLLVFY